MYTNTQKVHRANCVHCQAVWSQPSRHDEWWV